MPPTQISSRMRDHLTTTHTPIGKKKSPRITHGRHYRHLHGHLPAFGAKLLLWSRSSLVTHARGVTASWIPTLYFPHRHPLPPLHLPPPPPHWCSEMDPLCRISSPKFSTFITSWWRTKPIQFYRQRKWIPARRKKCLSGGSRRHPPAPLLHRDREDPASPALQNPPSCCQHRCRRHHPTSP